MTARRDEVLLAPVPGRDAARRTLRRAVRGRVRRWARAVAALGFSLGVLAACRQEAAPVASGAQSLGGLGSTWPTPSIPPRAVIPASAGVVDLVCALLVPERVAALPAQALRYSGLSRTATAHLARPTFTVYESERLLALAPDLVLAHPWQSADTTARLREAGVAVLVLPEANTWPAIREQTLGLGRLLDTEAEALALVERYDRLVAGLRASWDGRRRPTAICYTNGGAGGYAAGADTTNDEALRLAGVRNLAAETGRRGHQPLSFEELLALDPELIIVGGEADAQQPGGSAEVVLTTASLAGLQAVRRGAVVVLDSWLYTTTSHHLVDAAVELGRRVEPFRGSER